MGGEKFRDQNVQNAAKGSPPRGRGKAAIFRAECGPRWITPAWAGKRRRVLVKLAASRDHPRVGGEKSGDCFFLPIVLGSPPRGRGKGTSLYPVPSRLRITPAWAGKRGRRGGRPQSPQDHPRVGGEKSIVRPNSAPGTGSPPRGRGKAFRPRNVDGTREDHPRVGGEKTRDFALTLLS